MPWIVPARRGGPWARRHPWRTLLLGILALIVAAGATVTWQLQASALPERINMGADDMAHHHDGAVAYPGRPSDRQRRRRTPAPSPR